jgi:ankyrin repeat protein
MAEQTSCDELSETSACSQRCGIPFLFTTSTIKLDGGVRNPSNQAGRGYSGSPSLNEAISDGLVDVVASALLLSDGSHLLDTPQDGDDPALILAAKSGRSEIVSLLLSHKADIKSVDRNGLTALHHAAEQGHADIASLLLTQYSTVQVIYSYLHTPFILAAKHGHREVVSVLLSHKVSIHTADENYNHNPR